MTTRRTFLGAAAGFVLHGSPRPPALQTHPVPMGDTSMHADLILFNGRITTLDRQKPEAGASPSGTAASSPSATSGTSWRSPGPTTQRDRPQGPPRHPGPDRQPHAHHPRRPQLQHGAALGRRALAGRCHARCSRSRSTARPPPQWVRVVGGFTEHQFAEKRLPTLDEINAVAPDTPVFILHLYDRALLNGAALRAVGYTKDTPNPPGGEIERDAQRQSDGPAARQAQCHHPLRDPGQGPEAAARVPEELDAPLHARAQPARRHRRHRRRRRLPELSGRLPDHRGAAPAKAS